MRRSERRPLRRSHPVSESTNLSGLPSSRPTPSFPPALLMSASIRPKVRIVSSTTFAQLSVGCRSMITPVAPYPLQFPKELVACLQISIDDHGDRTFADRRSADCCAECPSQHQL